MPRKQQRYLRPLKASASAAPPIHFLGPACRTRPRLTTTGPMGAPSSSLDALWQDLEAHTAGKPLVKAAAMHQLQQVSDLMQAGSQLHWPSVRTCIAMLCRTDDAALIGRLVTGWSVQEFHWMLHTCNLFTAHRDPVRFQRCLNCMVAKQGPCGTGTATWLCRSRLGDAEAGRPGGTLRPRRQDAICLADARKRLTTQRAMPLRSGACVAMHDGAAPLTVDAAPDCGDELSLVQTQAWGEVHLRETFHVQAMRLWQFVTQVLEIRDREQLWDIVNRACLKRYMLSMLHLWERGNCSAGSVSIDRTVLGVQGAVGDSSKGASKGSKGKAKRRSKARAVQVDPSSEEASGFRGSLAAPETGVDEELFAQLRAEMGWDGSSEGKPWHWLDAMRAHPKWEKGIGSTSRRPARAASKLALAAKAAQPEGAGPSKPLDRCVSVPAPSTSSRGSSGREHDDRPVHGPRVLKRCRTDPRDGGIAANVAAQGALRSGADRLPAMDLALPHCRPATPSVLTNASSMVPESPFECMRTCQAPPNAITTGNALSSRSRISHTLSNTGSNTDEVMVPADAVQLRIGNTPSTLSDTCCLTPGSPGRDQGDTMLAAAVASMTHTSMLGAEGPLQELTSPDALLQFADAHMYDSHVHELGLSSL